MNFKKVLFGLLSMMMVVLTGVTFIGCGDDGTSGAPNNNMVGTWSGVDDSESLILTFNSDGSGTFVEVDGSDKESGTFTYTMEDASKGIIRLKRYNYSGGTYTEVFYFVLAGNKMSLFEDGYGYGLEWVLYRNGSSASDPDDSNDNDIVGEWSGWDGSENLILTFNSNGNGTYVEVDGSDRESGTFTYTMEGTSKGIVRLNRYSYSGGSYTEIFYFVIEGNKMSLYEHYYGDDLEWVLYKDGSSASDPDDSNDNDIVGEWSGWDGSENLILTFNSNGNGTYVEVDGSDRESGTFTYTMEGTSKGIVRLNRYSYSGGSYTEIFYFVIEGNKMSLYEHYYGDDLEWVLYKNGSNVSNPDNTTNYVVGVWSGWDGNENLILTFNSNGNGTYVEVEDSDRESGTFTYTMEGASKGIMRVSLYDYSGGGYYTEIFYFVIEGNKMSLYEHDYGDDLEWVLYKQQ